MSYKSAEIAMKALLEAPRKRSTSRLMHKKNYTGLTVLHMAEQASDAQSFELPKLCMDARSMLKTQHMVRWQKSICHAPGALYGHFILMSKQIPPDWISSLLVWYMNIRKLQLSNIYIYDIWLYIYIWYYYKCCFHDMQSHYRQMHALVANQWAGISPLVTQRKT